jgi:hypothetical protein
MSDRAVSLQIEGQGSFFVGGSVVRDANSFEPTDFFSATGAGTTLHGDHAYVQYQVPVGARHLPLVLWHGGGQSTKTWETTPDGRDGYQNIMLRREWSVYMVDQARRGRAAQTTDGTVIAPVPNDGHLWQIFRLGEYPEFFANTQFPASPEALVQFWRQTLPNTGPEDAPTDAGPHHQIDPIVELFSTLGAAVLITHSQSGRYGWITRIREDNVKAIVAYEPSTFTYRSDQIPAEIPGPLHDYVAAIGTPILVEPAEMERLADIPIQIVYGDNFPRHPEPPSRLPGIDLWRVAAFRAEQFAEQVNALGGNVSIVHLPDVGLVGNTHFPFSDLNNLDVADLLSKFLSEHGLDDG